MNNFKTLFAGASPVRVRLATREDCDCVVDADLLTERERLVCSSRIVCGNVGRSYVLCVLSVHVLLFLFSIFYFSTPSTHDPDTDRLKKKNEHEIPQT